MYSAVSLICLISRGIDIDFLAGNLGVLVSILLAPLVLCVSTAPGRTATQKAECRLLPFQAITIVNVAHPIRCPHQRKPTARTIAGIYCLARGRVDCATVGFRCNSPASTTAVLVDMSDMLPPAKRAREGVTQAEADEQLQAAARAVLAASAPTPANGTIASGDGAPTPAHGAKASGNGTIASGTGTASGNPPRTRPSAKVDGMLQAAADLLQQADALVIAAGAGMSVDSGLPDYR